MDIRQFNKLSMYNAVDAVLLSNKPQWEKHIAFSEAVAAFGFNIAAIRREAARQEEALRGVRAEKEQYKEQLARLAAVTASNVRAYASAAGDEKLAGQVRFSFSDLLRSKDARLVTRATIIHEEALSHLDHLAGYNVTRDSLEELLSAIRGYESRSSATRVAMASRSAFTTGLSRFFRQTDTLLRDRIDLLMFSFNSTAALFYDTYRKARVIVDSHRHGTLVSFTVKGGESVTVKRVIFDTPVTNTGSIPLVCTFIEKRAVSLIILPGKAEKVKPADGIIKVTNEDRQKPGSFSVRVTSTRPMNEKEEEESV